MKITHREIKETIIETDTRAELMTLFNSSGKWNVAGSTQTDRGLRLDITGLTGTNAPDLEVLIMD